MTHKCLACDIPMIGIGSDQLLCAACLVKHPRVVQDAQRDVQREQRAEEAAQRRQQEVANRRLAMRAST